jgi:hypothetical protein
MDTATIGRFAEERKNRHSYGRCWLVQIGRSDRRFFEESSRFRDLKVEAHQLVHRPLLKLSSRLPTRERRFVDLENLR